MTKAVWIDHFAGRLSPLLPWVNRDEVIAIAAERWETMGEIEPGLAAQAECDEWPPREG